MGTDKQLVELIHVKALEVLRPSQPSAHRYQSITLFLRGGLLIEEFSTFAMLPSRRKKTIHKKKHQININLLSQDCLWSTKQL